MSRILLAAGKQSSQAQLKRGTKPQLRHKRNNRHTNLLNRAGGRLLRELGEPGTQKDRRSVKLEQRCEPIRLILSDVDGVLTDGGVVVDNQGIETKTFNIRDGLGIKTWQRAGYEFGLVTGRSSHVVQLRARELSIDIVRQGVSEKWPIVEQILGDLKLEATNLCYIGDDLPDLPVIRAAGLGVAVADAAEEVRSRAQYVTSLPGGKGAVREIIEVILKNQHRWDALVQKYETG